MPFSAFETKVRNNLSPMERRLDQEKGSSRSWKKRDKNKSGESWLKVVISLLTTSSLRNTLASADDNSASSAVTRIVLDHLEIDSIALPTPVRRCQKSQDRNDFGFRSKSKEKQIWKSDLDWFTTLIRPTFVTLKQVMQPRLEAQLSLTVRQQLAGWNSKTETFPVQGKVP